MLKGVAIWTKNLKVFHCIIFAVAVFMVNAKNCWNFAVSASLTFFYKISNNHIFTNRLKGWVPNFFFWFVNTCNAAKFSRFTRACQKRLAAMFAIAGNSAFKALRFVIACFATIFSGVGAGRYVVKCRLTNIAICGNLHAGSHSFAGSGTILKTGKSVFGNISKCFAMPTWHLFSSKGF